MAQTRGSLATPWMIPERYFRPRKMLFPFSNSIG